MQFRLRAESAGDRSSSGCLTTHRAIMLRSLFGACSLCRRVGTSLTERPSRGRLELEWVADITPESPAELIGSAAASLGSSAVVSVVWTGSGKNKLRLVAGEQHLAV